MPRRTLCGGADGLPDAAVELDVLVAVGADADDRGALGGQRARQRAAERRRRRRRAPSRSRTARRRGRSRARGAWRCARRTRRPRAAAGRKWKIPPPSLSISTMTSFSPRREAASSPPMSCASATSPISSTTGPRDAGGDAEGGRDRPVDPVRAAVGQHAERRRARREERLDVADRHRGGDDQRRLVRAARDPSSAATRGSFSPRPERARRSRPPRRGRPRASASSQRVSCALAAAAPASASNVVRGSAPTIVPTDARRVLPRGLGVERDLQRVRAPPARRAAAWRSGRSPTRSTRSGACARPTRRRAAARRSARSRPARGARPTADRPAAARPPRSANAASAAPSRGSRSARPATTTARGRAASSLRQPVEQRRRRARAATAAASPTAARRRARPRPRRRAPRTAPSGTSGSRNEKFRCTGPGRPSTAVQNARQASCRSQRTRAGDAGWSSTSKNHLAALPVELDLIDRLPGADVAQLRRAVGGQHQQRHPRLVRLDHRRRVVRRRRPRRAGQHRAARPVAFASPSAKNAAQRSSMCDVARSRGIARERQHQRRRARARRGARVAQPAARRARRRRRAGRDRCRFQA